MRFSSLAYYWQKLERTTSRNEMMQDLAEVLKEARAEEVDKVCYLSLGRLGPLFAGIEFNLAEKMMVRAIAQAVNKTEREIKKLYKQKGDLGLVVEFARSDSKAKRPTSYDASLESSLAVVEVYSELLKIAREEGEGSQERKLAGMAGLLSGLDPVSARYGVRIPLGKMRLGFSDKTILDALSFMCRKDKSGKKELEEVYKVRPDIGLLARIVKEKGIEGIGELKEPEIGVPILMAKAQRMSSAEEILLKIGKCAVEPKIDGFRLQVHYVAKPKTKNQKPKTRIKNKKINNNGTMEQWNNGAVKLFTRNLDDVTYMYPDIVDAVKKEIKADRVIFEGEAVAYNPQTGEFLPFQETVQRKRKYDIEKYMADVPLKLIAFDCLYLNGKSLLDRFYIDRRKKLEEIIKPSVDSKPSFDSSTPGRVRCPSDTPGVKSSALKRTKDSTIIIAEEHVVGEEEQLEKLFEEAVSRGLEGVMAKRLDAPYQAGARSWNWIKYKRSYSGELADTVDCLVMGYDFGKGKRADFGIGGFLVGVYDEEKEIFRTVSKVGTGLTDEQWRELRSQGSRLKAQKKPKEYEVVKEVEADVWITPKIVVEIEADEITRSPVHTAGLALRFPRLKRFRDDKRPEQATTMVELRDMFQHQRKLKVK